MDGRPWKLLISVVMAAKHGAGVRDSSLRISRLKVEKECWLQPLSSLPRLLGLSRGDD